MRPNRIVSRLVLPFVLVPAIALAAGCDKKEETAPATASSSSAAPNDPWLPSGVSSPQPSAAVSPALPSGAAAAPATPSAAAAASGTTVTPAERVVPPLPAAEPPPRPVRIRVARNEPHLPTATDATGGGVPGLPGMALPPGLPPGVAAGAGAMLGQMMGSVEEVPERPGLPHWERLAPFEPDRLGAWPATGPANGATAKAMGMTVSTSSRSYDLGGRTARVVVNAGDVVEMAAMELGLPVPDESTPEHVQRHVQVAGQPGIVEWWKGRGTAEVRLVVANTYQVSIEVIPADSPDQALAVANALDLAGLARLR